MNHTVKKSLKHFAKTQANEASHSAWPDEEIALPERDEALTARHGMMLPRSLQADFAEAVERGEL